MNAKVFVLGRPGSGKSTAARYINQLATQQGWSTRHINDYDILKRMFLEDVEHKKFLPTANNGFDAIDLTVLDTALQEVEQLVEATFTQTNLVTIEFARNDYAQALEQFSPDFLQDAYFLFLDVDIDTCLQRVHARVEHSNSIDDHPSFSDDIFRIYYNKDNRLYMSYYLQKEFAIRKPIQLIENIRSLPHFLSQVSQFTRMIFQQEEFLLTPIYVLAD